MELREATRADAAAIAELIEAHSRSLHGERDLSPSQVLEVRPMREGEQEQIHAAHMDAFADHWDFHEQAYEQWRRWHRDCEFFDPSLWFLAFDGSDENRGEIAGFALCGRHFSGEPDFGWVELLGVRPPWRRRGLGEALLRHGFRELQGRGFTRVGLGVDAENTSGAVRLYERVGMTPIRRSDTWELRTGELRTAEPRT